MAQIFCCSRAVQLFRKNGTLAVAREEQAPQLLPLLQISEIFALAGASVDPALTSLLAETRTPLHCFGPSGYEGSWMPYQGLISGKTTLVQYKAWKDEKRRRHLALRLMHRSLLLRIAWVKKIRPDEERHWEERYLATYREAQVYPARPLQACMEAVSAIDDERRQQWGLSRLALNGRSIGLALAVGTFANVSLDPWCSLITETGSFPLARDLAFLLEPCFVEGLSGHHLPQALPQWAKVLPQLLKEPFARNRGKTWSLRSLARQEAYFLLGAFRSGGPYRPAWNVEVKTVESLGSSR